MHHVSAESSNFVCNAPKSLILVKNVLEYWNRLNIVNTHLLIGMRMSAKAIPDRKETPTWR